jgi:hypothetical protein
MEQKWITCGGCGASEPKDRCLGCWHEFDPQISNIKQDAAKKCDDYITSTSDIMVQVVVKASDISIEMIKRFAFNAGCDSVIEELRKYIVTNEELNEKIKQLNIDNELLRTEIEKLKIA